MTREKRVSAAFYHQEEPYVSAVVLYVLDVDPQPSVCAEVAHVKTE